MIVIVSIPWIFEAIESESKEKAPDIIALNEPITEIPKEYNDNPRKLLEDYQNQEISLHQVIQILILYQDEGMFLSLYETDTRQDLYWIHRKQHDKIEAFKKNLFRK